MPTPASGLAADLSYSWAFYEDLLAEPSIREAPIRFIATTIPGFGGTAPPDDSSVPP